MKQADYIKLEQQYGANNYKPLDVVLSRGEGVWVYDVDGKKYLDCLSAYSAVSHGHCHPRLRQVFVDQLNRLTLTSRAFRNDQLGLFYQTICQMSGYERFLPMNSGSEAVEAAIKVARKWAYEVKQVPENQAKIIVCDNNFHGRTTTVVSFSSDANARAGYGPFTPGFEIIPYSDSAALEEAIDDNTAAFLVEPIQGEAGVIIPNDGFLSEAAQICRKNNVLLICDEIQTGLGRTGYFFAQQHDSVRADISIVGKALAGGFYPVSGILADDPQLGLLQPGQHGSTFGGNPLACAVAREALQVLKDEKLVENAASQGGRFLRQLQTISNSKIKEIRGRGLLLAVEFYPDLEGARSYGGARAYCEQLHKRGILCKETHENTIRFAPPLILSDDELDWALDPILDILSQ